VPACYEFTKLPRRAADKELSESVEHVARLVVGFGLAGLGLAVGVAGVFGVAGVGRKVTVFVLVWVFRGAHEEHVLEVVGQALGVRRVLEGAGLDAEGR
jgi:hypothetical protein